MRGKAINISIVAADVLTDNEVEMEQVPSLKN
jgi:hypothetical protein